MSVEKKQKLIKDNSEKKKPNSNSMVRAIQDANSTQTFGASLRQFFKINPEEKDKQKVVTILEKLHKKELNYNEALYYLISQVKFLDCLIKSKPQVSEETNFIVRLADIKKLLNKNDLPEWLRNIKDFIDRQKMKTVLLNEAQIKQSNKVSSDVTLIEPGFGFYPVKVENQTTMSDPTKCSQQKLGKKSEEELIVLSEKIEMLCRKYELEGENVFSQLNALDKKLRDMTIYFQKKLSEKIVEKEKEIKSELKKVKQDRDIALIELKKLKDKSKSKVKTNKKYQIRSLEKQEKTRRQNGSIEKIARKIEEPFETVPNPQTPPALKPAQTVLSPQNQNPSETVPYSSTQPTLKPSQAVPSLQPALTSPQYPPKSVEQTLPRSRTPVKQQRSRTPRRQVISSTPQGIVDFLSESEIVNQTNEPDIRFLKSKISRLGKTKIKSWKLLFTSKNKVQKNVHTYFDNLTCILFLIKLNNGVVVGAYSRQSFHPNCSGNIGFIFNLTRRQAFEKVQGSTISYHEESIVFGKNELRIKTREMSLYSNFGAIERNFLSNNKDINYFIGCGEERFTEFQVLQIFQIIEE